MKGKCICIVVSRKAILIRVVEMKKFVKGKLEIVENDKVCVASRILYIWGLLIIILSVLRVYSFEININSATILLMVW